MLLNEKNRFITQSAINFHNSFQKCLTNSSDILYPVTNIFISDSKEFKTWPKDKVLFCYKAAIAALDSCLIGRYTDFDAQTTTNCCHGITLFVKNLILSALKLDLFALRDEGIRKTAELEELKTENQDDFFICNWHIPDFLIDLTRLYILTLVKEKDENKGFRTSFKKLKYISPLGTKFSIHVIRSLQKYFSRKIALLYQNYLSSHTSEKKINNISIKMWGKYISTNYLKEDQRGNLYASNLYSMQIVLAQLILEQTNVVLINDLLDLNGNSKARYVLIYKGNGDNQFKLLDEEEIRDLASNQLEPAFILGGCVYSNDLNLNSLNKIMYPWLNNLQSLILACDVYYPEFPIVNDDFDFDNAPIFPEEESLKQIISEHLKIKGTSSMDPSLFCLSHIYPASIGQVLKVLYYQNEDSLPLSFIPQNKSFFLKKEQNIEITA